MDGGDLTILEVGWQGTMWYSDRTLCETNDDVRRRSRRTTLCLVRRILEENLEEIWTRIRSNVSVSF